MAKKLRVLTPQTTDGKTLAYDADKQPIYSESIVELSSKRDFESLNARLPEHLRHKLEEFDDEQNVVKENVEDASQVKADAERAIADKDAELVKAKSEITKVSTDAERAIADKDAEIAELKKQLDKTVKK